VFKRQAGIDVVHVPYKGTSALTTALMSSEIDFLFDSGGAAKPFIDSGRIRALAVTGKRRSPVLPDVPSLSEVGVNGVDVRVWIGMFAPKGMPQDLVAVYSQAVRRLLQQDADVRKAFADNGTEIVAGTPQAFSETLRQEKATWQALIASLKLAKD
jgi:tripartite-type tricarboxylate transporter receptor subunit TctC